jgi:iron complex transport system ATP-binding protein
VRLAARDLAIGYPGKPVGRGISSDAGPGDVLCLLGPNGSGKTTLFRTVLGLIPKQGGEVLFDGTPIGRLARAGIARRAAYVPQAHVAPFAFTAEEIVLMGRTARLGTFAQPGAEDRRAARAALDRLGILDLAGADYTRLSGGQRQLVLIARALAQAAPVLVMDEPTASLDFGNQVLVIGEIARRAGSG